MLLEALKSLGYTGEYRPSASDPNIFIVNGWTTQICMDESIVIDWTKKKCQVGYTYDCDFVGWGTQPEYK